MLDMIACVIILSTAYEVFFYLQIPRSVVLTATAANDPKLKEAKLESVIHTSPKDSKLRLAINLTVSKNACYKRVMVQYLILIAVVLFQTGMDIHRWNQLNQKVGCASDNFLNHT